MFGEQIFQSVRPSVGQWGPPAWLHHLAVIRTQRNTRVNAPTALVLLCVWIYISQHVCLCLHFVCAPQSYTTTEQKRNSRNRKLNLKGVRERRILKGLKAVLQRGNEKVGEGPHSQKVLPFSPPDHSISRSILFYHNSHAHNLWPFLRTWQRNQMAVNGWLEG